jgi:hypothetical protein
MSNKNFVKTDEHLKHYIESNTTLQDECIIKNLIKTFKYNIEEIEFVYSIYFQDRDVDFETIMQKTNNRTDKTFKEDVKNRYNKCIVSDYHKKQCDVAHIKPFSECKSDYDRYNPNNGLLLSSDIHKQFDMYLFTIHPETFEIIINEDVEDIEDYSIYQYNKKILNINKSSSSYLKYHYEQFKMHI